MAWSLFARFSGEILGRVKYLFYKVAIKEKYAPNTT